MSMLSFSNEPYDPISAAYLVAKTWIRKLDVFTVVREKEKPFFGFLTLQWAIASDVDFESEKWRCCGGARFTWTGIIRILCLYKYSAALSFLPGKVPLQDKGDRRRPLPAVGPCVPGCKRCLPTPEHHCVSPVAQIKGGEKYVEGSGVAELADFLSALQGSSDQKGESGTEQVTKQGAEDWVTLDDDDYVLVWALNVPYPSNDMNVAPLAHLSDGMLDLAIISDISKARLASMFLTIEKGKHLSEGAIEYVKVTGLRLNPKKSARPCELGIDGEHTGYQSIELRVFRGILNWVCR